MHVYAYLVSSIIESIPLPCSQKPCLSPWSREAGPSNALAPVSDRLRPLRYRQALPLRPECQSFSGARRWSSEPVVGLGPGSYQSALAQHVKGVVKMSTAQR